MNAPCWSFPFLSAAVWRWFLILWWSFPRVLLPIFSSSSNLVCIASRNHHFCFLVHFLMWKLVVFYLLIFLSRYFFIQISWFQIIWRLFINFLCKYFSYNYPDCKLSEGSPGVKTSFLVAFCSTSKASPGLKHGSCYVLFLERCSSVVLKSEFVLILTYMTVNP